VTAIVIGMVLIVVVALVVLSVFSAEEEEDWTKRRPGRTDPDEGGLDDLLG
jgi:multisubunit Na+/H+ antiporter MnhC subunit